MGKKKVIGIVLLVISFLGIGSTFFFQESIFEFTGSSRGYLELLKSAKEAEGMACAIYEIGADKYLLECVEGMDGLTEEQIAKLGEPITPTRPTCSDTDGGYDYFKKGTMTAEYVDLNGVPVKNVRTDYCDGNILSEFSCISDSDGSFGQQKFFACSEGCSSGACKEAEITSHSYYACYGDNVYWYDSEGIREDMKERCLDVEDCSAGRCVSRAVSHSYYACHSDGNVRWFDSEDNFEDIKEECASDEICLDDKCVPEDTPCVEGEKTEMTCWDGSKIVITECKGGELESWLVSCPKQPDCTKDSDCDEDQYCSNDKCVNYPPPQCVTNLDCREGELCVGKTCVKGSERTFWQKNGIPLAIFALLAIVASILLYNDRKQR